jgi:dTDP-4-amino-4,6-dideoxygalactose transaminase
MSDNNEKKWEISFGDLVVSDEAKKLLEETVDSGQISGGKRVKQLEENWGKLFGYNHNIGVTSGTDAGTAACMALYDLNAKKTTSLEDNEIIAPALAYASVGMSIIQAGFKPVFVDIDRKTLNINPDKIKEKITEKTRAIKVVHTMGKPCDMDKIRSIAHRNKLLIIEDCCEAHGAKYKGEYVGTFGDIATFSYYVAHVISCGTGGMISTNNPVMADILNSIKFHGRKPGKLYFDHERLGLNFRLNDLTACVGIPEVKRFQEIFDKRKDNLYYLLYKTKDLRKFAWFNLEEDYEKDSAHAFSVTLKNPQSNYKGLFDFLEVRGIQCKRNFGSMPTQHKAFKFLGHKLGEFPEAEYVGDNGLHFGIHQYVSRGDLNHASEALHSYFSIYGKS